MLSSEWSEEFQAKVKAARFDGSTEFSFFQLRTHDLELSTGSAMLAITPKNFWLWFGGIWFAVGMPFLFIGLYFGFQHITVTKRLDFEGRTVEGMVLTKARKTSSSSSGRSGSSTPTYEVTFRFLTRGGLMQGKAEVPAETWDTLIEREPIQVTYLPDNPQHHRIAGQPSGWWLPVIFTAMGGFFGGLGGFILLQARNSMQIRRRLQHEGVTTTATVSEVRAANMRINGVQQLAVHYEYQDERGRSHTGKEAFSPEEAGRWKEGDRVTIRYDRRRPDQSTWVGTA